MKHGYVILVGFLWISSCMSPVPEADIRFEEPSGRKSDGTPSPLRDACGDVRVAPMIFRGEASTFLTPGQQAAVGWFAETPEEPEHEGMTPDPEKVNCSGTVVAPRWVVTASHCDKTIEIRAVEQIDGEWRSVLRGYEPFRLGNQGSEIRIPVVGYYGRISPDLAAVELGEDATKVVRGLTPIPLYRGTVDRSWIGRQLEVAGYGRNEETEGVAFDAVSKSGELDFLRMTIVDILSGVGLALDGPGNRGPCYGDSGGPALYSDPSGRIYVAGVLHIGKPYNQCAGGSGLSYYTPVDGGAVDRLVNNYGAAIPGPDAASGTDTVSDPDGPGIAACGTLDPAGRCSPDGRRLYWCDANGLHSRDCAGCNQTCSEDTEVGANCVD